MGWKQNNSRRSKWCWMFLLSLTAAPATFAQATLQGSAPPNLEILNFKWEREVRLPRNFDPSVIPTGGTFSDPASRSSGAIGAPTGDVTRSAPATRTAASNSNTTFPAIPGRLPVV